MSVKNKKTLGLLALITLGVIGIVVAVLLTRRTQDVRNQAAIPNGPIQIAISPTTGAVKIGEKLPLRVILTTNQVAISGFSVRLTYAFTDVTPSLVVSDLAIGAGISQVDEWTCPVKTSVIQNKTVQIDVACIYAAQTGFTASGPLEVFSFALTAEKPATQPIAVAFSAAQTVVSEKSSGQDRVAIPTSQATITIQTSATPTPTPTPTPIPTPTPTPTPVPPQSCWGACDSSRACASGLTCTAGKCIKSQCPSDATCGCSSYNVASSSGTTQLPSSGTGTTTVMTLLVGVIFLFSAAFQFWIFTKSQ